MFAVVVLCLFWMVAGLLGASREKRLVTILTAVVTIVALHLILPETHGFRLATGGSAAPWLLLLGGAGLVALYRVGLGRMRKLAGAKAQAAAPKAGSSNTFSDIELERYARHIVLREIGGVGQKRLKMARILVIGAGGLGAPVLQYLAAAGVGTIGVIDDDTVENSNLQRQVIHTEDRIGMPKVHSASQVLLAQNPHITVLPYHRRFAADIAEKLVSDFDIVIDGCDNFETRYLVNETCARLGKPLVSGALSQWEGQVTVFDPKNGTPCYQCIFPQKPASGLAPSCAEAGVFASLPGVIGSMMAGEAMKLAMKTTPPLLGEMFIYDALYGETRKIKIKASQTCPICNDLTSSF